MWGPLTHIFRIKSNGDEKLIFSDLEVHTFCNKPGSIITFVDITGRQRTANDVVCKNKSGPVHVSVTESTEVILAYPVSICTDITSPLTTG